MAGSEAAEALRAVADQLYGLRPAEFTAARTAAEKLARSTGDRELAAAVKALRRPSAAAWAVNLLVRERRDLLTQVVELGQSLREAQASLAGDALRELTRQRRQLLTAVTAEARAGAADHGESLSEAAARQVEETLLATMTDRSAADAVLTGLLTQPLSSTGLDTLGELLAVPGAAASGAWGEGDSAGRAPGLRLVRGTQDGEPDGAPEEAPGRVPGKAARDQVARDQVARDRVAAEKAALAEARRAAARKAAEERVARTEGSVRTAASALERVRKKKQKRQARVLQLENELDELRRRVADLEEQTDEAAERLTDADSRVEEAEAELAQAEGEAEEARAALADLE